MIIEYKPIGIIHTPFNKPIGIPIQTIGGIGVKGYIEINKDLIPALKDLEGFSHIILLYHFHRSKGYTNQVVPFMDEHVRGLFSTRAPKRPNPIGISIVRLKQIEGNTLFIEDIDILDGTPLLDIKPYVPLVDSRLVVRIGWLTENVNDFSNATSNDNFQ